MANVRIKTSRKTAWQAGIVQNQRLERMCFNKVF